MNKNCLVKIKEIFESIQGEGPYVGYKQLFIRFCNCNLKCNYCDTEFSSNSDFVEYSPYTLANELKKFDLSTIHSISLTGGEPLLSTEFLKDFLPLITENKIYLETNATLADKFLEIKPFVDIVSADIKLESATGIKDSYKFHEKFFENCRGIETFAKIVFNKKLCNLNFEKYMGPDLWQLFLSYIREDSYSNENYISDGLSNAELISSCKQLIEKAKSELVKSGEKQYSITSALTNLLLITDENNNCVFEPILDDFTLGNFIRCKVSDDSFISVKANSCCSPIHCFRRRFYHTCIRCLH